ncbi:hypothetical protein GWK47_031622 [Chionoecetes opilio]|uniref:Uncharacterized protein n=1 Tax=Chionoecetes opilio TaxID=41210 RepID=A0A8J4YKY6_CHIOP|nr:hypothetical protein GWK47_031622 [Chionoecetes opilio]
MPDDDNLPYNRHSSYTWSSFKCPSLRPRTTLSSPCFLTSWYPQPFNRGPSSQEQMQDPQQHRSSTPHNAVPSTLTHILNGRSNASVEKLWNSAGTPTTYCRQQKPQECDPPPARYGGIKRKRRVT